MTIFVNGNPTTMDQPCSIDALLAQLGYEECFVAVARNREHVRRSEFRNTQITNGDEIEILAPTAGG